MLDLQWDQLAEPMATNVQLDEIEATLDVKIPRELRDLWTRVSYRTPQRNNEDACYVILQNSRNGTITSSSIFQGFSTPDLDDPAIDWLKGKFDTQPRKVIAFAYNGVSSIFLNYDNDPTNSNPEIWDSYTEGDYLDESWYLVAHDVSSFFTNLKTETELSELNLK